MRQYRRYIFTVVGYRDVGRINTVWQISQSSIIVCFFIKYNFIYNYSHKRLHYRSSHKPRPLKLAIARHLFFGSRWLRAKRSRLHLAVSINDTASLASCSHPLNKRVSCHVTFGYSHLLMSFLSALGGGERITIWGATDSDWRRLRELQTNLPFNQRRATPQMCV